jgi:hypothetical protein
LETLNTSTPKKEINLKNIITSFKKNNFYYFNNMDQKNDDDRDFNLITENVSDSDISIISEKKRKKKKKIPDGLPINALKEFCKLEKDIRSHSIINKEFKKQLKEHKKTLFDYLIQPDVRIIKYAKENLILEIKMHEFRAKPTPQQQKEKLKELLDKKIDDPVIIFKELRNCGSITTEPRMYKKKLKRVKPLTKKSRKPRKKIQKVIGSLLSPTILPPIVSPSAITTPINPPSDLQSITSSIPKFFTTTTTQVLN